MTGAVRQEAGLFLLALQFMTRLPVPGILEFSTVRMAASARYFPCVGLVIGALAGAVYWGAAHVFPTHLAVLLSTAATMFMTGALHEDGLADVFDGIGGGATRDSALEIMKDSRIGVYGAVALGLTLAMKVTTLGAFAPELIVGALIAGHCLSRLACVVVMATSTYVREEGTGASTAGGMSRPTLMVAASGGCLGVLLASLLIPSGVAILGGCIGAGLGLLFMRWFYVRKLDGYTGDCLGATQQLSELGFYMGVLACL